MRVPTAADTPELKRIVNQACRDALEDLKEKGGISRFLRDAVNWSDLHFCELETTPRVIVEEAGPNARELQAFIRERLRDAGFDVDVETAW